MPSRLTIIGSVTFFVLDRLAKLAIQKGPVAEGSFFGFSFPKFTFHQNFGLAFDLAFSNLAIIIITSVIILILIMLLVLSCRQKLGYENPLLLIILGAASNFYDRLFYGSVIDMIEVFKGSVWNVADFMIMVGLIWLILKRSPANSAR